MKTSFDGSEGFRVFALSSARWLGLRVKNIRPWCAMLAETGFTDYILMDLVGREDQKDIAEAVTDAGLGLVVGIPSPTLYETGPFMNAFGWDARKFTLIHNHVWNFFGVETGLMIHEHVSIAIHLGATMGIVVTSTDQASWPVWWPKAPEHWGSYACHHPKVIERFHAFCEQQEYPSGPPARRVDEDHDGRTFLFVSTVLSNAVSTAAAIIRHRGLNVMVTHEFSPYCQDVELAGGRYGLLADGPLGADWVFVPQVYIPWDGMPYMNNQRVIVSTFARTYAARVAPGAQQMPGILQLRTLQKAVSDGHAGAVCGIHGLLGTDGSVDTKVLPEARKIIKDAKDRYNGKGEDDALQRDGMDSLDSGVVGETEAQERA